MTSYLAHSDDIIKLLMVLRDFVPEYHHAKLSGDWTTNEHFIKAQPEQG